MNSPFVYFWGLQYRNKRTWIGVVPNMAPALISATFVTLFPYSFLRIHEGSWELEAFKLRVSVDARGKNNLGFQRLCLFILVALIVSHLSTQLSAWLRPCRCLSQFLLSLSLASYASCTCNHFFRVTSLFSNIAFIILFYFCFYHFRFYHFRFFLLYCFLTLIITFFIYNFPTSFFFFILLIRLFCSVTVIALLT